jgi:hypothetical protein
MLQQPQSQQLPRFKRWILLLVLVTGMVVVVPPGTAQAHCDSVDGPVVSAARQALVEEDVDRILPYVQPDAEQELTAAFQHVLAVRALGPEAQELADHYFFETAVRLHRAGEGAPYTGLKAGGDPGPALAAAEEALESGSLSGVYRVLNRAVREGIDGRYAVVVEARAHAAEAQSVEAERERVEAELLFETYVFELYTAALGEADPHGAEAAAHGH